MLSFMSETLLYTIIGIIAGLLVNKIAKILFSFVNNTLLYVLFHIILTIIVLYLFEIYTPLIDKNPNYVTPGVYFTALFISLQMNVFDKLISFK